MYQRTLILIVALAASLLAVSASAAPPDARQTLLDQLTDGIEVPADHPAAAIPPAPALAPAPAPVQAAVPIEAVAPLRPESDTRAPAPEAAERTSPEEEVAEAEPAPARRRTPLSELRDRDRDSASSPSMGYTLVGIFLLGLAGLAIWLKRRAAKGAAWADKTASIETLAQARIAGKHTVSVVRVAGRVLVLGVSDGHGVNLLTELEDNELNRSAEGGQLAAAPRDDGNSFMDRIARLRGGFGKERVARDPFHEALEEDAPVDELMRLDERAAIRERLEALRSRSVA